jgi:hypothetical protein
MRKLAACLSAALLVSIFVVAAGLSQEYMTQVDAGYFPDPQRPPAAFPHDEHNEAAGIEDCNACHHVWEDGVKSEYESSEDMLCVDCHALETEGPEPPLRRAFHNNCKGCHMERKAGPILCGECHRPS